MQPATQGRGPICSALSHHARSPRTLALPVATSHMLSNGVPLSQPAGAPALRSAACCSSHSAMYFSMDTRGMRTSSCSGTAVQRCTAQCVVQQ